uniref:7TM_GPCR_Srx domain-containing protein n=1 Tax=Haemonchus placei TaxID=6290 RepID=A0A0N4X2M3_HAEPC
LNEASQWCVIRALVLVACVQLILYNCSGMELYVVFGWSRCCWFWSNE